MLHTYTSGFNQVVQESKGKADDALKRVPDIEALIEEAERQTQEARDALSGAEKDANDALSIAEQAENTAQDASDVISLLWNLDINRQFFMGFQIQLLWICDQCNFWITYRPFKEQIIIPPAFMPRAI